MLKGTHDKCNNFSGDALTFHTIVFHATSVCQSMTCTGPHTVADYACSSTPMVELFTGPLDVQLVIYWSLVKRHVHMLQITRDDVIINNLK